MLQFNPKDPEVMNPHELATLRLELRELNIPDLVLGDFTKSRLSLTRSVALITCTPITTKFRLGLVANSRFTMEVL